MDPELAAALAVEPFAHLRRGCPEGMSLDEYAREARKMVAVLAQHYEKQLDGRSPSKSTTRLVHHLTGGSGSDSSTLDRIAVHSGKQVRARGRLPDTDSDHHTHFGWERRDVSRPRVAPWRG